jgi:hypothetical protein
MVILYVMFDGELLELLDTNFAVLEFSSLGYMEWKLHIITKLRRAMLPFNAVPFLAS